MLNITKIEGGFQLLGREYLFAETESQVYDKLSETQVHVHTNQGTILVDTTCTVNGVEYTDIDALMTALVS